jgi:hypothetical protein
MWSVWGAIVLMLAGVWLYRSRLERDEEDQIFIDEAFSQAKAAQAALMAKVAKVQPIMRAMMVVSGVATLFVIGYYVLDIINQFK